MRRDSQIRRPESFVQSAQSLRPEHLDEAVNHTAVVFAFARVVQRLIVQSCDDYVWRRNGNGHNGASREATQQRVANGIVELQIVSSHKLFGRFECGQLGAAAQSGSGYVTEDAPIKAANATCFVDRFEGGYHAAVVALVADGNLRVGVGLQLRFYLKEFETN